MLSKALVVVTSLGLAAVGASAGSAVAAPPVVVRDSFTVTFADEFLTAECGIPVETTVEGSFVNRAFEREGVGPTNVFTINATVTATAGDNTVRFKDVGGDFVRRTPNGDLILTIVGQVPFSFKGAFKVNLTTGEVLREPRDLEEEQLERVCAVLNPEG